MGSDLCRLRPHGHDWPPPSPRRNGIVAGPGHGRSLRARSPAHDPVAGRNRLRHRRSASARSGVVCVGKGHPQRRTKIWPVQVAASRAPRPLGDRGAGAPQGWPRTGRSGVGDGPQQRRTESWPVQVGACPSGGKWDEGRLRALAEGRGLSGGRRSTNGIWQRTAASSRRRSGRGPSLCGPRLGKWPRRSAKFSRRGGLLASRARGA